MGGKKGEKKKGEWERGYKGGRGEQKRGEKKEEKGQEEKGGGRGGGRERIFSHSEWSCDFCSPQALRRLSFPGSFAKDAALLSQWSLRVESDLVTRRLRPSTSFLIFPTRSTMVTHSSMETNESNFLRSSDLKRPGEWGKEPANLS